MSDAHLKPWDVDHLHFPLDADLGEQLRFLIHYAVLAPSGHNVQPWRFHVQEAAIEVWADTSRALPRADPDHRELHISCGAALENLALAMRHYGRGTVIELLPDGLRPELLARLSTGTPSHPGALEELLFRSIPDRHTYRLPFAPDSVSEAQVQSLQRAARVHGQEALVIEANQREAVADLVAQGDRRLNSDPDYRQELSHWMRTNFTHQADGIPAYSLGMGDAMSLLAPFFVAHWNLGEHLAREDRERLLTAPLALVLCSPTDNPKGWLQTGRALQRLWLTAVSEGLQASFLNQPIQLPDLRQALRDELEISGYPQVLLRLGSPLTDDEPRATPRRDARSVTD